MKKVLTIAGSDCSGGAGIQADLKTIMAHKMYGMSVITALTAQNTTGVYGIAETAAEFVANQIDCIFNDIRPEAVKIGMVASSEIIEVIAQKLIEYNAENIVVDPVMVSTSGSDLMENSAVSALREKLIPLADIITPNIPEAEVLSGIKIRTKQDMEKAAEIISKELKGAVLLKGGHLSDTADDLFLYNSEKKWFSAMKIDNPNTHGTGCTLSSAIACNLADGKSLCQSAENGKKYITGALKAGLNIGKGKGPLNHMFAL